MNGVCSNKMSIKWKNNESNKMSIKWKNNKELVDKKNPSIVKNEKLLIIIFDPIYLSFVML